ncbi:MAG: MBL fold metallo-hydrolase [Actinomycetes bacterium]|jgi:L-ascorbate metabolism protein UlaG (beta-lactamase superfamily)|nr:MBL fold metallo-hydrolase [Actinomycetes bacterium]
MPKLLYLGHGSLRLTADSGGIVYIDPFAGDDAGYAPAPDLVLITHEHGDHTDLSRLTPGDYPVIRAGDALSDGQYATFTFRGGRLAGLVVRAVPAGGNSYHSTAECVGWLVQLDGVTVYVSGDTSWLDTMASLRDVAGGRIDYALFCADGYYNMDPCEAARCARDAGAVHNILYHMVPDARELYDATIVGEWDAPGKLDLPAGTEIELTGGCDSAGRGQQPTVAAGAAAADSD